MKFFAMILTGLICIYTSPTSAWEDPLPTTREDIVRWFENGINQNATHLLVVSDQFSYEDFPDYVYWGEQPIEKINYWNSQQLFNVMEVYALHLDMNTQIDEYRSWHLEVPSKSKENIRFASLVTRDNSSSLQRDSTISSNDTVELESIIKPAPWEYNQEPTPLPENWEKHQAQQNIVVDYLGHKVNIPEGDVYFTYKGKVAIGWHGSYNPPCGM